MLYAYAAIEGRSSYANGAPNLTVDIPAMLELAKNKACPSWQGFQDRADADEDGPGARLEGAHAGSKRLVLHEHPGQPRRRGARRSGLVQDQGGIEARRTGHILQPEVYPELYGNFYHKVRINYYPPRGDNKEGWDNIDISDGWVSDADQGGFPVPRFDSGRADRP